MIWVMVPFWCKDTPLREEKLDIRGDWTIDERQT